MIENLNKKQKIIIGIVILAVIVGIATYFIIKNNQYEEFDMNDFVKTDTEEYKGNTIIVHITGEVKENEKHKESIVAVLYDEKQDKYLTINWGDLGGRLFVGGTRHDNESAIDCAIREIKEEIGIEFIQEEGKFLGTIQKKNYFRDVWKFKGDISKKDIYYNDGEVIDSKWVSLDEYVGLYNKGEVAPSGDFVIKMLKEKELEEER